MTASATELHPQYIKDDEGKESFVVLPVTEYEELLEDLDDLAAIAESRQEPTMSLDELKTKLGQDGLLIPVVPASYGVRNGASVSESANTAFSAM